MLIRRLGAIFGSGLSLCGLLIPVLPSTEAGAAGATVEGPRNMASRSATSAPPSGLVLPMAKFADPRQFEAPGKSSATLSTKGNVAGACPGLSGGTNRQPPCSSGNKR